MAAFEFKRRSVSATLRSDKFHSAGVSRKKGFRAFLDRKAFNWKTRAAMYRHLSTQLSNDVATIPALEKFQARLARKKRKDSAKVVGDMVRRMRDGKSLSEALSPWVPQDEIMIIASGELSGQPSQSFDLVLESKERAARVKRALTSALVSPTIYLVALYGMLWAIGRFVIPGLEMALPASRATGMVAFMYEAGAFANSWYAAAVPVLVIAIAILVVWSLPRWGGKGGKASAGLRIKMERYFPYSFYRDMQGYTWLLGFSALLRAGMSDVDILEKQSRKASPWLRARLVLIRRLMDNGKSLPEALYNAKFGGVPAGFPNPDMIDDIASMSGFKDFPERIAKVAAQWADELEFRTTANAKTFGFVVEIVMYGAMGFLMVAINSLSTQMGSVPGLS